MLGKANFRRKLGENGFGSRLGQGSDVEGGGGGGVGYKKEEMEHSCPFVHSVGVGTSEWSSRRSRSRQSSPRISCEC